jgi:hypothetical protein
MTALQFGVRLLGSAAIVLGCASPDPRAPWIGRYRGLLALRATDCDTGERFESAHDITVEIVPVASRLAINGACSIEFVLNGALDGRVQPSGCSWALDDGTPVRTDYVSGRLSLDGDELSFEISSRREGPTWCETANDVFVGLRQ